MSFLAHADRLLSGGHGPEGQASATMSVAHALLALSAPHDDPEPDPVFHTSLLLGSENPVAQEIRRLREQADACDALADSSNVSAASAYHTCGTAMRHHAERFATGLRIIEAATEASLREMSDALAEQTAKTLNLMTALHAAPVQQPGELNSRIIGRYEAWYEGTRRNALIAAEKTDATAEGGD